MHDPDTCKQQYFTFFCYFKRMQTRILLTMADGLITAVHIPAGLKPDAAAAPVAPAHARAWYLDWLEGDTPPVPAAWFAWSGISPFRKKVLAALQQVPHGRVVSYAGLARLAGCPAAVRAVAGVMAANPYPLFYPCHRVVSSDRRPGAYSRRPADPLKRRLLEREGVRFDPDGRIASASFFEIAGE